MLFILGLEAINTGGIESISPPLGEDLLAQLANTIIIIIYKEYLIQLIDLQINIFKI